MNDTNLFLSVQHPVSKRWAILEDDGTSAWLYLTKPDTQEPVADVFVYNRFPPIAIEEVQTYRNCPPPVAIGYAGTEAYLPYPDKDEFYLDWSADGQSVAVWKSSITIACILNAARKGFSRNLIVEGPWGYVWSQAQYDQTFHP